MTSESLPAAGHPSSGALWSRLWGWHAQGGTREELTGQHLPAPANPTGARRTSRISTDHHLAAHPPPAVDHVLRLTCHSAQGQERRPTSVHSLKGRYSWLLTTPGQGQPWAHNNNLRLEPTTGVPASERPLCAFPASPRSLSWDGVSPSPAAPGAPGPSPCLSPGPATSPHCPSLPARAQKTHSVQVALATPMPLEPEDHIPREALPGFPREGGRFRTPSRGLHRDAAREPTPGSFSGAFSPRGTCPARETFGLHGTRSGGAPGGELLISPRRPTGALQRREPNPDAQSPGPAVPSGSSQRDTRSREENVPVKSPGDHLRKHSVRPRRLSGFYV